MHIDNIYYLWTYYIIYGNICYKYDILYIINLLYTFHIYMEIYIILWKAEYL